MGFKIRGDNEKLKRMAEKIGAIGSPGSLFRQHMGDELSKEILDLIHDGFDRQQDPYGNLWPERKVTKNDDGHPLLQLSMDLRSNFDVRPDDEGNPVVTNPVAYAMAHQRSLRVWLPTRQMVPTDETGGIGEIWGPRLKRTANRVMRAWLER